MNSATVELYNAFGEKSGNQNIDLIDDIQKYFDKTIFDDSKLVWELVKENKNSIGSQESKQVESYQIDKVKEPVIEQNILQE